MNSEGFIKLEKGFNTTKKRREAATPQISPNLKSLEEKYNNVITKILLGENRKFIRLNELMKFVNFDLVENICEETFCFRIQTNDPQKFILFWKGVFYIMSGTFDKYEMIKECQYIRDENHPKISTGYTTYTPIILDEKTQQISKVIGVLGARFSAKEVKENISIFDED